MHEAKLCYNISSTVYYTCTCKEGTELIGIKVYMEMLQTPYPVDEG